ncbi:MAG: COX15/CtaA family protein [Pseudomonadota bacterium]
MTIASQFQFRTVADVSRTQATTRTRVMSNWLFAVAGLVALMVLVGGATRLTDSGLSITEWKPVTGAVPPLSLASWEAEFEKYKIIPEYALVNQGMSLGEFKVIYWWEWGHRFLGRIIGLAFAGPLLLFAIRGWLTPKHGVLFGALLALGGAQGALGWWMVSSGLVDRVDVSQYRLAAHLGLAVFLLGALLWSALWLRGAFTGIDGTVRRPVAIGAVVLLVGVYGQIILGAFVAGLRAGASYNTWPLMGGRFFPEFYFEGAPRLSALFESVAAVQFNHRLGAYVLTAAVVWFYVAARSTPLAHWGRAAIVVTGFQVALGIATVVSAAHVPLALAHQATAILLYATAVVAAYGAIALRSNDKPS